MSARTIWRYVSTGEMHPGPHSRETSRHDVLSTAMPRHLEALTSRTSCTAAVMLAAAASTCVSLQLSFDHRPLPSMVPLLSAERFDRRKNPQCCRFNQACAQVDGNI